MNELLKTKFTCIFLKQKTAWQTMLADDMVWNMDRNFISLWEETPSLIARKGVKSEEESDFIRILMVP